MKQNSHSSWLPFGFSVALCVISLVTYAATGGSGAWIPAFVSFLPLAFYLGVVSQNRADAEVVALEIRIRQLEANSR